MYKKMLHVFYVSVLWFLPSVPFPSVDAGRWISYYKLSVCECVNAKIKLLQKMN